ncbi:MAG: methyltransferase domain-containing protein [Gammaproteobacteria bacterium]|jgi:SAM-dependent methyltransferase
MAQSKGTDWFDTALGRSLIDSEAALLDDLLEDVFGYFLLQVGGWGPPGRLFKHSRVRNNLLIDPGLTNPGGLRADPVHLPVASGSVDAVLLPHTLEFSPNPHQVLREAERVLVGQGRLIILSFNPASLWGLRNALTLGRPAPPWRGRYLSEPRLADWVGLLGLEVLQVKRYCFGPPVNREGILKRTRWMDRWGRRGFWGPAGAHVTVAEKRVIPVQPIREGWRKRVATVVGLPRPTARECHRRVS